MQLDLFSWAASRPSAIIIDARPRIEARILPYILALGDGPQANRKAAEVIQLRPVDRGAAA